MILTVIAFLAFVMLVTNLYSIWLQYQMLNELKEPETDGTYYSHSPMEVRQTLTSIADAFIEKEGAVFEVTIEDIEQFMYDFTLATGLQIDAEHKGGKIWHIKERK